MRKYCNIEGIIHKAEKNLVDEEDRIPMKVNGERSRLYNIKKLGLKSLLPFISKSPRIQNYFLSRARKDFMGVLQQRAEEQNWSEDYLGRRLNACYQFTDVLKKTLPRLNEKTIFKLLENFFYNMAFDGLEATREYKDKYGEYPPSFLLISPSMACNLSCNGCWASEYEKNKLSADKVNEIIVEAKEEMGIHYIVLTGGEPTIWKPIWDIVKEHQDVAFMAYTNGQIIGKEKGEKVADKIAELGNLYPCFSIAGDKEATDSWRGEGVYDNIQTAMKMLKERGVFFGFSSTHTKQNHDSMVSEEFFNNLIEKGCAFGWLFHYIPLGKDPNPDLSPTPEQRVQRYDLTKKIRESGKPIALYDFWMDGPITGGCIGWGRRYAHINADGFVEPCAFIHFSTENVHDKTLTECLNAPFFKEARSMQPFNENLLLPCPYIDNPDVLKHLVRKNYACPTHPGAEQCVSGNVHEAVCRNAQAYKKYLEENPVDY
ncbi:MAG: radical SAM protein [Nanoarchaeota archaeon]